MGVIFENLRQNFQQWGTELNHVVALLFIARKKITINSQCRLKSRTATKKDRDSEFEDVAMKLNDAKNGDRVVARQLTPSTSPWQMQHSDTRALTFGDQ